MRDVSAATPTGAAASTEIPGALRREVHVAAVVGVLVLVGASVLAAIHVAPIVAIRWAAVAVVVAGGQLWLLTAWLDRNRRAAAGRVLPSLGAGTALTLTRSLLVAGVAGLLAVPAAAGIPRWIPGAVYGLAVLLDGLDGAVARRRGITTRLGAALDTEIDALGLLAGALLAITLGRLPAWYLLAGLARYAYVAALAVRRARGRPIAPLPASRGRRVLAVTQMLVVTVALLAVLDAVALRFLAAAAATPFLLGFVRDWLAVTGRWGGVTRPPAPIDGRAG